MTSKQKRKIKNNLVGYSFILPNLIGYTIFIFLPVCFSLILSVMEWDGSRNPMVFVGLENFKRLINDSTFRISFINTLKYAVFTVPITVVASLLLAVLLNKKIKGIAVFRTSFFFPYIASLVAVGAVWNMLFQPEYGPINNLLRAIGIANPPRWVVSTKWAMMAVIIVSIWKFMGYYMIVYLAALQGISPALYEAASIDGANGWRKLRYITIPLLTPTTFFVMMMLTIQCFKVFDLIYVMTGGGPGRSTNVLVNFIYNSAFVKFDFGYASAAAIVLFVIVLVVTLIQFKGEKKFVKYM
ncbi:sugar ABC transporter permease [Anaerocolumna aminovalerica]|jgi:multiple sugar transport system permease protein|uniref:Carbohydrate ABC transporter membrane protein 1, CUT1 family n=1 Tax=Anaerocolumna aminovalerica TaxID=1527 RepID=A0A1I5FQH9_9FIRM|nr:sugar ABC transporter permease [Anaerocolumna aminovalerica]MBU5331600.1 sugar ABC transporter permease [Anaerocolumna aminovalerica]MDU6265322.1 sugar ABC transporter permease [Anaerocolumna aminovalerica]SFO25451.1 carbohydrate ABC transporter membrane protein 1, CUT1 family [Anaerocolumna aminovalerica]